MAVREVVADPLRMRPARVRRVRSETGDTVTLTIEPPEGHFAFTPGQFDMLYVFGAGEVPISISGDPTRPEVLFHTVRAVGAVTGAICAMRPGAVLGIRGPLGSGWPEAQGRDLLIVAGGIGLAPLRPVLYDAIANRDRYGRVTLLYGARSPAELLYRHDLERWRSHLDLDVAVTVDAAGRDWHGRVGVVTTLIPEAACDPERTVAFVCGPEIMMRFTVPALERRGLPPDRIYLSMERNMQCGVGLCGHCQFGPVLVCRDGPVIRYDRINSLLTKREI